MSLTETIGSVIERRLRYPAYRDTGIEYLPQIPSHWSIVRLKNIATLNPEVLPEDTDPSYRFRYVDISSVSSGLDAEEVETIRFEDAPSRARRIVRQGDTYISTVRTYLRAIGFVKEDVRDLIVSTGFAVLRPGRGVFPPFLYRLVDSSEFVDSVVAHSVGVGYPAISPSVLAALPVWLPPLDEQRAIAAFLDRETAQIDALIAKKERLIALLQEKRTALISHAVTKGLDPTAPTRDSGIPWIGQIPANWGVSGVKHISDRMVAGPFGSSLTKDMYSGEGYRVYGQEQVIPGDFKIGNYYIPDWLFAQMKQYATQPGDVLVSCVGSFGRVAVVPSEAQKGIINPRLVLIRPDRSQIVPAYLETVLRSAPTFAQFEWLSRGGTMGVVNLSLLAQIRFPLPPIQEQAHLLDHINREASQIERLVGTVRRHCDLLREHRTALISAAVTGKIDVRGEV